MGGDAKVNRSEKRSETKTERFVRVAETRTNKIIAMIRLLGNCSGRGAYAYSQSDVKKIFSAIERELSSARKRFADKDGEGKKTFSLR